MKLNSEIVVCIDSEIQNKIKIKEDSLMLDKYLQNEESFPYSHTMKMNNSDVDGIVSKIEFKEEPWWQQVSTEVTSKPESVLAHQGYSEMKDGVNEDFSARESTRLHTEAPPSTCSTGPCLFSTTDLEEKEGHKHGKGNREFAGDNLHEISGSDIVETSALEQNVCHHKTMNPHVHKTTDKLNKCSNSSNKFHACKICKKTFSRWNNLKAHILTHEGTRPFKCDVCESSFSLKGNLKRHILVHQGEKPFKCDICEKHFTEKGDLKRHVLIHQGKRPFKCDICGKSFTEKGNLKRHILFHQNKRPFQCNFCEKSFTEEKTLKRHIPIHQHKRAFKCNVCEKSFLQKGDFNVHFLIHQGKKPFRCNICEKKFTQKGSLNRHILIHQGKRTFKCNVCGKSFTKRNLNTHILIHQA